MITKNPVMEIYQERKRRNPTYSIRALSRDSGVNLSLLSRLLRGMRPLTFKQVQRMKQNLKLTPEEVASLLGSLGDHSARANGPDRSEPSSHPAERGRTRYPSPHFVEAKGFEFDLNWKDLAVLNLTLLSNFEHDIVRIGKRLGIRSSEVADAIERLTERGLLVEENGKFRKLHQKMLFTKEKSMDLVRAFHRQMIAKASQELEKTDPKHVEKRLVNGYTIAIDASKIDEAKKRIEAFQQEMTDFLSDGKKTELYQLNVQFFPLSLPADRSS